MFMSTPSFLCKQRTQPFEFLQHLQGCHKGQTLEGVQKLKQYLEKFGYLHYQNHSPHANDEEFDELLESAVKTYQLNYHLKVTGSLDSETVKQMKIPRCGVADIIQGSTRMLSGNSMHHHDPNSFHSVSHFSFFPKRQRWPPSKTDLTYRFNSSISKPIDLKTLRPLMSRAFERWAAVSNFTFQEATNSSKADIVIGFHSGDHGDNVTFDGPGGVLAHAFAPSIGWFHYDVEENWSTKPTAGHFDLETVAVHEIGHLLGLGHSSVSDAIMFPSVSSGVTKRDLHENDIAGLRALYAF
ncbi:hypothetical protein AQUCO_00200326v1 [Aquilegia coerulea]|uniref:Peptidase metallopeptidase domain-containing protein n=1 Tax=Aquilegia coerulea TaxID=218851 RepID=A0A2G5F2T4_AQUCA|nr:hypothetical protein AQUCO_00200326v1 [Aquilegia coerulea]